ncbi:MAG: biotin/lipoyl-binding protein [Gemmatimonadetes bacterium]|nr:biotin/lipoyl-binding protein [Gemmatimonadota bacterium]
MKYTASIRGRSFEIEVDGDCITLDGDPVDAELIVRGGSLYQLRVGGEITNLSVTRAADGWEVGSRGTFAVVVVEDRRSRLLIELGATAAAISRSGLVVAPMPGLVLEVSATVGKAVLEGEGLVLLEAMKMENQIKSPVAGRVEAVMVEAGQTVERGAHLATVRAEG